MSLFRYWIVIALFLSSQTFAAVERPCQRIFDYISLNLPMCGILEQDQHGYVYVDIDNDYIYKLTGLIEDPGYVGPDYFNCEDSHGAHISVMYTPEVMRYSVPKIEEAGMTIHFCVQECKIVASGLDPTIDSYYLLIVESPELEAIREKYGLPKPRYPFHITIGVKLANLEYEDATQALDEAVY